MAVAGGISAFFQPIVSSRPQKGSPTVEIKGEQDIDARLWQDPLRVALEHFEKSYATNPAYESSVRATRLAGVQSEIVQERVDPTKQRLLILPVMIPGGPYAEDNEGRLRTREAVVSGLAVSGYVPDSGEHIGYLVLPPPSSATNNPVPPVLLPVDVVPYEWFHPRYGNSTLTDPKGFERILIIWERDDLPGRTTLDTLQALAKDLRWDTEKEKVSVIGPGTSTGLVELLDRDRKIYQPNPHLPSAFQPDKQLQKIDLYAAMPTASDAVIALSLKSETAVSVRTLKTGPILHRPINTDDEIAQTIISELKRRKIDLRANPDTRKGAATLTKDPGSLTNIAVISEWDTIYGRALPLTLLAKIYRADSVEGLRSFMIGKTGNLDTGVIPEWFHTYSYQRGIDGRLPSDTTPVKSAAPASKDSSSPAPREATEGEDQSDYLRRLAVELAAKDQEIKRKGGKGLQAIGILGSDVYDKLMILRALRAELPGAVFFTNNLDARLGLREEWSATHNLIVVSPFGLSLDRKYQRNIPPFRDSYQTSVFTSTLLITGVLSAAEWLHPSPGKEWQHPSRIFEISRQGPWDLSLKEGLDPRRLDLSSWWGYPARYVAAFFAVLGFGAVLGWIALTAGGVGKWKEANWRTHLGIGALFAQTPVAAMLAGVIGVVCIWPLYSWQRVAGEPLAFLQGISVWPTEMMRVAVIVLCAHFVWKSSLALQENNRKIRGEYLSEKEDEIPAETAPEALRRFGAQLRADSYEAWLRLRKMLGPKKSHPESQPVAGPKTGEPTGTPNEQRFSAEELWQEYLVHGRWSKRLVRFGPLVLFYLIGGRALVAMLGGPVVPARGCLSFAVDNALLIICIVCTTALLFYVVDAIRLNRDLIKLFDQGLTVWPKSARLLNARKHLLNDEELSQYLNILLLAARTEVVCPLVNYPFIILVLLIVARNSYFDNWDWPLSLVIILTLNLAWAIYCSLQLYRAAGAARRTALNRLAGHRLEAIQVAGAAQSSYRRISAQTRLKMIDETINEIAGLSRGAFAPLSDQPFFRAILFASGGIGVGSLVQYLPNLF